LVGETRRSYLGVTVIALVVGSLLLIDTVKTGNIRFELIENRFPVSFDEIVSGDEKAFTLGGILRKPAQRLTFRFSYLISSPMPRITELSHNHTLACMAEIEPLLVLSQCWDQPPEIITKEVVIDGQQYRFIVYDFTRLLNATGELQKHNETLTTFCLALYPNGTLYRYYKGVSGFVFEKRTGADLVHLSIKTDELEKEYYQTGPASAYRTPSLGEGPKLGTIVFDKPVKGESFRITYTVEASEPLSVDSIQIARVYVDTKLEVCKINRVIKSGVSKE